MRIVLVDTSAELVKLWRHFSHISTLPKHEYGIIEGTLDHVLGSISPPLTVVSPGNSYGFMGGGFDLAICKKLGFDVEKNVRSCVNTLYNGYVPVGTPNLIACGEGINILHIPTMVTPGKNKSSEQSRFIFDLVWQILTVAPKEGTLLIPGLCTGYGGINHSTVAEAMVFAINLHFSSLDKQKCISQFFKDPLF